MATVSRIACVLDARSLPDRPVLASGRSIGPSPPIDGALGRPIDAAAQRDLLEVALAHSPRVEEGGPGLVYVDVSGLRGLFGSEAQIGRRLLDAASARGLRVRVGIAGSRAGASIACRWRDGVTVIEPGDDARYLTAAPVSLLDPPAELAARLDRWGVRTLGELAGLPAAALFERLGAEGIALQHRARGDDRRPLTAWTPPAVLEESVALEVPVDTLEPVMAIAGALAGRLADRLVRGGCSADRLEWVCELGGRRRHEGSVAPAVPTSEPAPIARLLRASLAARPPSGSVVGLTVRAHPIRVAPLQSSLIDPARGHPRLVGDILTRVAALVGAEHIGMPALADSHRADALDLTLFPLDGEAIASPSRQPHRRPATLAGARSEAGGDLADTDRSDGRDAPPALALRRFRPRVPARVEMVSGRPVALRSRRLAARIVRSVGPWRASGDWWTGAPWVADEWDVELGDGVVCRLSHDGSAWWLDGVYD